MPQGTYHFPKGFLWGTATASHQVEGNNKNNNWSAWEEQPGRILNGQRSGLACDWWGGRWKEDFDRAVETGQNTHRLSIEWSRIQPEPERWDEDALDYYRQMVRGLVQRKMVPMVTLHHFTDPIWLCDGRCFPSGLGAWENEEIAQLYVTYVRKVVEALKEFVTYWVTINEPNVYVYSSYMLGAFPSGKHDLDAAFRVFRNMIRAHAAAYRVIHEIQPAAQVGYSLNYRGFRPAHPSFPPDVWISRLLSANFNEAFPNTLVNGKLRFLNHRAAIPEAINTQDFFGLNYYSTDVVTFDPKKTNDLMHRRAYPVGAEVSSSGFIANVPQGMFDAINWARHFHVPIMITENGVDDSEDHIRPGYLVEHIHKVWRAVNFNWPVKGYYHWSLVDNFEWDRGWTQRFGLWGLDVDTQARFRRPSVDIYAAICKLNGISSEMVGKYTPKLVEKLFPG
ncbi:MAG: glycoside hydrolase family 1 protein [Anaerolineaceae bacterium]|nr:glycoside hydrolase family 1 protein [Anaerolineaceae bacterium]